MGKKKLLKEEKVSQDEPSSYQIAGEAEIGKVWIHQLTESEREWVIGPSAADISINMHLNGLIVPETLTKANIAQTVRMFVHSLCRKNGLIESMNSIDEFLVVQTLEKKLLHVVSKKSVAWQILAGISLMAWIYCETWKWFFTIFLILWNLPTFDVYPFFNPQIFPVSLAPLLMLGPMVVATAMEKAKVESYYPLISVLPAILAGLVSIKATSGPAVRRVYKLGIASILFYNAFMLIYLFCFVNKSHAILSGVVFNWPLFSGLAGIGVFALIMLLGFTKDIVAAGRNANFWKSASVALSVLAPGSAYTTNSTIWWRLMVFVTVISVLVAVPAPSKKVRDKVEVILCFILDVAQYAVMIFQTVIATVVIFRKSPKMGIEWIKYMFRKKSVPQQNEM